MIGRIKTVYRGWAVVGGLALLLLAPVMSPGFGLPVGQSGLSFSPTDSLGTQLVEPRLGTWDSPGWLASTLVARAWLLVPLGDDASRLAGLALAAGVVTALLSFFFYRRLGMSFAPAVVGALVVTVGGVVPVVSTGNPDTLASCLAVAVAWGGLRVASDARPIVLAALLSLVWLSVGSYPDLLIVVTAVVASGLWHDRLGRWRVAVALLGGSVVAVAHRAIAARLTLAEMTAALPTLPDPFFDLRLTPVVVGRLTTDAWADRLSRIVSVLFSEFGLLAMVLVLVGVTYLVARPTGRGLLVSWVFTWLVAVVWDFPGGRDVSPVARLFFLLVVGAGLEGLWSVGQSRAARAGVLAIGVVLIASGWLGPDRGPGDIHLGWSTFGHRLRAALPQDTVLMVEHPRFDRALYAATSGGTKIPRLPLHGALARETGTRGGVAAFSGARSVLERVGLQFVRLPLPSPRVDVVDLLQALPQGTIVGAAAGPALGQATTPYTGRLFDAIGGGAEFFGDGRSFYGVIGVVGRGRMALEHHAADSVELELGVGDEVGRVPQRAMAHMRVQSDRTGAWVALGGQEIARARVGLALVAVAPDGRQLAVVGDELADGLLVSVAIEEPELFTVVGSEPCVPLVADRWVDVGTAAVSGALGVDWPHTGAVLYTAGRSDNTVRVRPVEASSWVVSSAYSPGNPVSRARLDRQLAADDAPFGEVLYSAPVVRRLDVTGPGPMAIELGEAPMATFIRYEPAPNTSTGGLVCGAVSGVVHLDVGAPRATTIPARDWTTNGWGWHDLEEDAGGRFRWSAGSETELLVQLAQPGPIRVEVDAWAAAAGLTDEPVRLTLVVNGDQQPSVDVAGAEGTYAWLVPGGVWTTGMNRIGLRVSSVVSPAALGVSEDARVLGLALRRLTLIRMSERP